MAQREVQFAFVNVAAIEPVPSEASVAQTGEGAFRVCTSGVGVTDCRIFSAFVDVATLSSV